jgi:hypothetical protein
MLFSLEMVFQGDVASYFLPLYNQKNLWICLDMSRIAVNESRDKSLSPSSVERHRVDFALY